MRQGGAMYEYEFTFKDGRTLRAWGNNELDAWERLVGDCDDELHTEDVDTVRTVDGHVPELEDR